MSRIITCISIIAISFGTTAAVLSPSTKLRLEYGKVKSREASQPPYRPLLLEVNDEESVHYLKELGVLIFNSRDNILLACVPMDMLDQVLGYPGVIGAEVSGEINAALDEARPYCSINLVQNGTDNLPEGFDGKGIVVGFSDIGFDAQHIAFKGRISAIYDYNAAYGERRAAETPEEIAAWTTDNADNYHATHVGNILGGNYRGNGYYGVATGAEMVAATSRLTDVGILAGVEDIISYAKNKGKRAVINMSLGSHLGAHDGTSLVCRYLASCAEDAVICLSASNTGETSCYASAELDETEKIYRVLVNSLSTWNGFEVEGMTEFWSDTSNPFDFRIEVWDMDRKDIAFCTDWVTLNNPIIQISTNSYPEWGAFMDGEVMVACGVSPGNQRYCVSAMYDTKTSESAANSDERWSRYYTSLAFKSNEEISSRVHVDIFSDAFQSYIGSAGQESCPDFSYDGTISELCTAEGVISVGSCATRCVVPSILSGSLDLGFPIGVIAGTSAYSDVFTIPRLPHFSAPGKLVVSAMSGPFLTNSDEFDDYVAAKTIIDGKNYYWAAQGGTSMASPLAAGIMAQWLQADPTLTNRQLIEIAQKTARTDFADIDNPRWGAGCIDAFGGIKSILQATTDVIESDNGACDVYNLQGIKILRAPKDKLSQYLPAGFYIADRELIHIK